MAIRKSSNSGIPFGNTAGRPASPSLGQPYFNGEIGRLELYSGNGWQNIVQETPGVASASGHYYESDSYGVFTVAGTNFVDGAIAYAVGTNGTEYEAQTTTYNSLVQLTVTFANLSAAYEPYDIKITNPSNLFGLLPDAFYINDSPVWSTSSGSLGTFAGESVSVQLSATDDESNSLTYSVSSGSLPTGLSLSSSGLISGTNSAVAGTYTFTVTASDSFNTAVSRSFSMISSGPTVAGGTLSSDSTYYYRAFISSGNLVISGANLNLDILTIAGGGGGARPYAGAGGSGGATIYTSKNTNAGTHTITVGAGGNGGTGNGSYVGGSNGTNSQFASLVSGIGGGSGAHYDVTLPGGTAASGGSGGGGGGESDPSNRGNSIQTASGSGYTSYGNIGGYGSSGSNIYRGGGGGGLGSAGIAGGTGGTGGAGTNVFSSWLTAISSSMSSVTGWSTATSSGYIGGGGGGGIYSAPSLPAGAGGIGGGGAGGVGDQNGTAGIANTGSGGGGAGGIGNGPTGGGNGASGGSGIVIVRYTKAQVGG